MSLLSFWGSHVIANASRGGDYRIVQSFLVVSVCTLLWRPELDNLYLIQNFLIKYLLILKKKRCGYYFWKNMHVILKLSE